MKLFSTRYYYVQAPDGEIKMLMPTNFTSVERLGGWKYRISGVYSWMCFEGEERELAARMKHPKWKHKDTSAYRLPGLVIDEREELLNV